MTLRQPPFPAPLPAPHSATLLATLIATLLAPPALAQTPPGQDTPALPSLVRVVTDGRQSTPDDLILTLKLAPGETLRALTLADDPAHNLLPRCQRRFKTDTLLPLAAIQN